MRVGLGLGLGFDLVFLGRDGDSTEKPAVKSVWTPLFVLCDLSLGALRLDFERLVIRCLKVELAYLICLVTFDFLVC